MHANCPSSEVLRSYQSGDLPGPTRDEVADHLQSCPACEARGRTMMDALNPCRTAVSVPADVDAIGATRQLVGGVGTQRSPLVESEIAAGLPSTPAGRGGLRAYRLLATLGQGGMGVVFKALHVDLGRIVALKMIVGQGPPSAEDLARFHNEAEAAARLQHPNLVQIYEIGRQDGEVFLALEYVDGGSLKEKLADKPQPARQAAEMVETLARAIHHAHERGVLHRDLKPANILLTREGTPKITDFGLAKQVHRDQQLTQAGTVMGTPAYMPPEQALGDSNRAGPTIDVYSLGVILYQMLTGRVPFQGATAPDTLMQVKYQEPVPPRRLQPGLPRDLETICLKCLEKDAKRRYASAGALADDLRSFLAGNSISARPASSGEKALKWARRQPLAAGLLAGIVLVGLAGFLGVFSQWRSAVAHGVHAEQKEHEALLAKDQAETALYFSRTAQARLEWRLNFNMDGALALLEQSRPNAGEVDRRGFEWHYLNSLMHADLMTLRGHPTGFVHGVAYSPDGRLLASAGGNIYGARKREEMDSPGEIVLWDADAGTKLAVLEGHTRLVNGLVFSPNGNRLASVGFDDAIRIWDVAEKRQLHALPCASSPARTMAFSPDGLLLTGHADSTLTIWDIDQGKPLARLEGHRSGVSCLAFSPDGACFASSATDGKSSELIIWDGAARQPAHRLPQPTDRIHALVFSPDGRMLAGATHASIAIWDTATGQRGHTLSGHTGFVAGLDFRGDGEQLASVGADRTIRLWDVHRGVQEGIFRGHSTRPRCVAYHPNGHCLAAGDEEGTVKIWDITRHPEYAALDPGYPGVRRTEALGFAPDGQSIQAVLRDGKFETADVETGVVSRTHALDLMDRLLTPATLAAISDDCNRIATVRSGSAGVVGLYDAGTGQSLVELKGHTGTVYQVALSHDGSRLASCAATRDNGRSREIKVWDTKTGRPCLETLISDSDLGVTRLYGAVALSPDGEWLAFDEYRSPTEACVTVRAAAGGQEPRWSLPVGDSLIRSAAFSPDGKTLAVGDEADQIVLWDLETGERKHAEPLQGFAYHLAFSPDGTRLAAVNRELVKIWAVPSGEEVAVLRGTSPAPSDRGFNPQLAWSRDGRRLAASQWNRSVAIWGEEDPPGPDRHAKRREAARVRAFGWHLKLAEQALRTDNSLSFDFHWRQIKDAEPPDAPSRLGRDRVLEMSGR